MKRVISLETFKTPYGDLILASYDDKLCLCDWKYRKLRSTIDKRIKSNLNSDFLIERTDIINEAKTQLKEYFSNKRKKFDIPLLTIGTDFQKQVWSELLKIPFGNTISYLELSKRINNEKAIRAVASANGMNALSIFIPCHRVIGSNQELTGYAGGLEAKKKLLVLENPHPNYQITIF